MTYTYTYPRPALTVDAAVFRKNGDAFQLLLIQRGKPPFKGKWALPGGFVDMDETLEHAISRELEEETSLRKLNLHQLHAFSTPGRDPRGHTISVVFWGIAAGEQAAKAGDDASDARWFSLTELPDLAFDHHDIVEIAITKLQVSTKTDQPITHNL